VAKKVWQIRFFPLFSVAKMQNAALFVAPKPQDKKEPDTSYSVVMTAP
jgi:hypothetical protein